jgi:hypothetical protein
MSNIEEIRQTIAGIIERFGGNAREQRLDENSWVFRKGSATGLVLVKPEPDEPGGGDVLAVCEIMRLPGQGREKIYRRLLELNDALCGKAAFGVNAEDVVLLQAGRKLEQIDPAEIEDLLLRTAALADRYDDALLDEFGRELALV